MPYTETEASDDAFLRQLLLQMIQHRSLPALLQHITTSLAQTPSVALARIWLLRPGDICPSCHMAQSCQQQQTCLHLVASAGASQRHDEQWDGTNGTFRRFPLGQRKVGTVAQSNQGLTIPQITAHDQWIARPEWIKEEGIVGFTGKPLSVNGQVCGVLGIFTRTTISKSMCEVAGLLANHAAVTIQNAEAFEEIDQLKRALAAENEFLRSELGSTASGGMIIGQSPAIRSVIERIDLVAPTPAGVLIYGESGTGKELAATEIHRRSDRKQGPLVRVNCAAIPESLFESEFFGHVKGSFTGAVKDREGRFAAADGGTLFLDEIGEIPLALQGKLLRVLQEGTYERVGEEKQRLTDVRIIAATNKDLLTEVDKGNFRADLYYRLNVVPIQLPPLRERLDDLPHLASYLLQQIADRFDCAAPNISRAALKRMSEYDWPGNIRELVNVLERGLIAGKYQQVRIDIHQGEQRTQNKMQQEASSTYMSEADMQQLERNNLINVLTAAEWRISGKDGAADLLGIKPTTLSSRIKKYRIERPKDQRS